MRTVPVHDDEAVGGIARSCLSTMERQALSDANLPPPMTTNLADGLTAIYSELSQSLAFERSAVYCEPCTSGADQPVHTYVTNHLADNLK